MKLKLAAAAIAAGLMSLSMMAEESASITTVQAAPPEKARLSYAVGMRLGLQIVQAGTNVDVQTVIRAILDELDGKPTMIQESEIIPVLSHRNSDKTGVPPETEKAKFSYAGGMRMALPFKHSGAELDSKVIAQAMQDELQGKPKMKESEIVPIFTQEANYETTKTTVDNVTAGQAFLAENAKKPGVKTLPDGLQYEVIKQGDGPLANPDDLVFINFRGTLVNGVEFDKHPHFLTRPTGGVRGWKDVLPKMRVGSKWRIFVPPDLAFGHEGEVHHGVGPDATVIYDLEILSVAPPGTSYQVSSGIGKGLDVGASTETPN